MSGRREGGRYGAAAVAAVRPTRKPMNPPLARQGIAAVAEDLRRLMNMSLAGSPKLKTQTTVRNTTARARAAVGDETCHTT